MDRELVATIREQIAQIKVRRARGESIDPQAEANAYSALQKIEKDLEKSWTVYKNVGGPAESIDKVVKIPNPCGTPPKRPTY